jgi:hypothetical protein
MKLDDLIASLSPGDQEKLLQQVQEYKDAVEREKCQGSFMAYVKRMWPGFIHGRHHAVMAKKFEEIASGKLKRLCISLPSALKIRVCVLIFFRLGIWVGFPNRKLFKRQTQRTLLLTLAERSVTWCKVRSTSKYFLA